MPFTKSSNEMTEPAKAEAKKYIDLPEKEKRVLLFGVTAVLVVTALLIVAIGQTGGNTLKKCEGIFYQTQRYLCISDLANSTKNVSLCSHLPESYGSQCIERIAELEHNSSLCNKINASSPASIDCELSLSKSATNLTACRNFSNISISSSCIYKLASKGNFANLTYCSYIADNTLASNCNYIHYYNLALSTRNASYCLPLPDSSSISPVALLIQNASVYSGSLASTLAFYELYNATDRGICYFGLAELTNNNTLCSRINGTLGSICQNAIAETNATQLANVSAANKYCAQFGGYLQLYCTYGALTSVALRTNNVSICGQIGLQQIENLCIESLAKRYNESSYCGYMSDASNQSACYSLLSNKTA